MRYLDRLSACVGALLFVAPFPSAFAQGKCKDSDPHNKQGQRHGTVVYCYGNGGREETPYVNGKVQGVKKTYGFNGKLESETQYVGDVPNGFKKTYHHTGKLATEETLANYKQNGVRKEYSEEGHLKLSETYKADELSGERRTFHDEGKFNKVEKIENYLAGKKHGPFTEYWKNGKTRESGAYANGERDGTFKNFEETGKLSKSEAWKAGKQHGWSLTYYDNSSGYYLYSAEFNVNNERKLYVTLHANGKTDGITCYVNGQSTTNSTPCKAEIDELRKIASIKDQNLGASNGGGEFYANGKPKSKCPEKDGKRHGKCYFYYESGKVSFYGDYADGKPLKEQVDFNQDGKPKQRKQFENGELAKITEYFESGKKKREATIKGGKEAAFKEWYQNEELKEEAQYLEGGSMKLKRYHDTGEVALEETRKITTSCYWRCWDSYQPDGISKQFDEDGKLVATTNYKDGDRDGKSSTYHQNGKVASEYVYKKDKLVASKIYDRNGKLKESVEYFEDGSRKVKKAKAH